MQVYAFEFDLKMTDPQMRLSLCDDISIRCVVGFSTKDFDELLGMLLETQLPEITPHPDVDMADLDYEDLNRRAEGFYDDFVATLIKRGDLEKPQEESLVVPERFELSLSYRRLEVADGQTQ